MAAPKLGAPLADPPADGITSLRFSPGDQLLATSWDGTARIYDPAANALRQTLSQGAPVLDAAWQDEGGCLTAGLDATLKQCLPLTVPGTSSASVTHRWDVEAGVSSVIGSHDKAVRCVEWLAERGLAASGSWDGSLRVWDPRSAQGQACVAAVPLPGKAFSMSHAGQRLLIATSQRQILAFDVRRLEGPEMQRDSPLKSQIRCIRCFPDGQAFALSSVEGRVAVEACDAAAAPGVHFAFRCHRRREGAGEVAFPVNCLAFHPRLGTFATGGCDGAVCLWDPQAKKRLLQLPGYPTSIAALAFSSSGSQLAVAASYTFERGPAAAPADAIWVRQMQEGEVRPKLPR